ncbi:hypothetical protein [Roseateles puraquae]|uniref:hypothetical protein n=1 Tax=Roseateles puraquae TaxID=431059 RepID=UPI003B968B6C
MSAQGSTTVLRNEILKGAQALAVSLEPAGGSPTGAPTGARARGRLLTPWRAPGTERTAMTQLRRRLLHGCRACSKKILHPFVRRRRSWTHDR